MDSTTRRRRRGGHGNTTACGELLRLSLSPAARNGRRLHEARWSHMLTAGHHVQLSHPHMLILGRIGHQTGADAEEIGACLGLPVAVAQSLCADEALLQQ